MDFLNHHIKGFENIVHKDKKLTISSTSIDFEKFIKQMRFISFTVGYIPAGYEHRADLISDLFYNTPIYDWFILYYNNIKDPFNELNVGDRILIPNI